MKTVTEKRYYVTTKFEKYGTYTIMARSKEHAISKYENGEWDFDDYESDYGEYNEVIDEVEEEVFADTQLSLEGVMQPVKCNPIEYKIIMTYDSEHYYAVQTFLEDDELCKIWNIIEIAMNREGYDVSNAELSMRLFDSELTENIEHDMENLL